MPLGVEGPLPLRSSALLPRNPTTTIYYRLAYFYSATLAWFYSALDTSPAPKTSRPNTAPTFPPQILEAHPGRIVSKEQLEMMGLVAAPEPESVTQGPGQPRPVPRSRPQSLAGLCPPAHRRPSRPGRQWAGDKPPNCFPVIDAETSDLPVDKSNADGLTAY